MNEAKLRDYSDEAGATKGQPSQFECPHCMQLVYEPMVCGNCTNLLYCTGCVKQLKGKCGFCKQSKFVPNNRLVQNILDASYVICTQKNCLRNGEPLKYEELVQSHASSCSAQGIPCCFCGTFLSNSHDAKNHVQNCPKMLMECMCGRSFLREHARDHQCITMIKKHLEKRKKELVISNQRITM